MWQLCKHNSHRATEQLEVRQVTDDDLTN